VVNQVDLNDPVSRITNCIGIPHPGRICRTDPIKILVAGNARVGKLADDVAGDRSAE
jgi:hypothetical protein